jgi:hypothetical protein
MESTTKLNFSPGVGYFSLDELNTRSRHVSSRLQVFFCFMLLNKYTPCSLERISLAYQPWYSVFLS